jgi:hypothetical protein
MKIVKSVAIALMILSTWTACKKEKDDDAFKVNGVWQGTLTQVGQEGAGFFKFELKSNGTIERIKSTGEVVAFGTWQLAGDSLKATYTYITSPTVVNLKGVLNKNTKNLSGKWANSSEQGSWTADKK